MKRYTAYLSAVLLAAAFLAPGARAQDSYLDRLEWLPGEVLIVRDSAGVRQALVEMAVNWKDVPEVGAQHTVEIVPILISADSSAVFRFTPIRMEGRIRSRIIERERVLGSAPIESSDTLMFIQTGKKAPRTVYYSDALPYDPSMLEGRLGLLCTVYGCAGCLEDTDTMILAEVLPRYIPTWSTDFSQSPDGDNKHRENRYVARLDYLVNSADINPRYKNNSASLDGILQSVRTAMNDTLYTVRGLRFHGWASPDGTEDLNASLAARRAASLADYIKGMGIPDSLCIVEGGAEDWDGFFAAVAEHPAISGSQTVSQVRQALTADNRDSCERVLRADRELFNILREEILPPLRRIEYVIAYDMRNFTPEEAERLWQEHPEWLSINELNSVAALYGPEDPRSLEVLLTAARTYPGDGATVYNAALALYRAGRTDECMKMLAGLSAPAPMNLLGVIRAGQGDYEAAAEAFSTAAEAGNSEAAENLKQLENVLEQL